MHREQEEINAALNLMTDVAQQASKRGKMPKPMPGRILPLSAEAIAQIHSSKHITSLRGVVLALLENSLDAGATRVEISIDWRRGGATINDNGTGIPSTEFSEDGSLGKLYCTSKRCREGVQSNETHGSSGTFLAELAAMSLLSISSTYQGAAAGLTLHHGNILSRRLPGPTTDAPDSKRSTGTDVDVRDLFGNMPVRIKQRALAGDTGYEDDKSWNELKRGVVALLLAWSKSCSVKLRDANSDSRSVTISGHHAGAPNALTVKSLDQLSGKHVKSDLRDKLPVLFQSGFAPLESRTKWIPLSASTSAISLKGLICLDPSPTKQCQFIALGITPCNVTAGYNELYDATTKVFSNSSFGMVEEPVSLTSSRRERGQATDGHRAKPLQAKKGVDRFPMFYIQLKFKDRSSISDVDRLSHSSLKAIVDVLEAALTTWLESNHFRPKKKQGRRNEEQNSPAGPIPFIANGHSAYPETATQTRQSIEGQNVERASHSRTREKTFNLADRPSSRGSFLEPNVAVESEDLSALSSMRYGKTKDRPQSAQHLLPRENNSESQRAKSATGVPPRNRGLDMSVKKQRTLQASSIDVGQLEGTAKGCDSSPHFTEPSSPLQTSGMAHSSAKFVMRGMNSLSSEDFGSVDDDALLEVKQACSRMKSGQSHDEGDEKDENMMWKDPASKQVFRVNARTGVVLPISEERYSNSAIPKRQRAAIDATLSSKGKPLSLARRSAVAENEIAKRPSTTDNAAWLPGFLKQWNNPVFARQKEEPIPIASLDGPGPLETDANGKCCSHTFHGSHMNQSGTGTKLAKSALKGAEVIAQVDTKFILCKMPATPGKLGERSTLILIDQHAASERVMLENLLTELCAPFNDGSTTVQATCLHSGTARAQVLNVEVSAKEADLFARYRAHFARWGILYEVISSERHKSARERTNIEEARIRVTHLPTPVAERCANFPSLAIDMLRSEVWALEDGSRKVADDSVKPAGEIVDDDSPLWLSHLSAIPPSLLALLHSRSCRSAIMFNDVLSQEQCVELVEQLAKCIFPFVCAHGRISMVPLGDMDVASMDSGVEDLKPEGQAMGVWLRSRKEARAEDPRLV